MKLAHGTFQINGNLTRIAGMLDSEPSEKVMACATEDWNMEGPTSPTTRDRASTVP